MRRAILTLCAAGCCLAQTQAPRPAYEAASVKPNASGGNNSSSNGSKGQVVMINQTLKRLIERAYSLPPYQVEGPDWLQKVRFDIAAKYPPDTANDDRALMLRSLLEDRFHLAVHREPKEVPGYALVVAKGGPKLKPGDAAGDDETSTKGVGHVETLTAANTSMATLADLLSRLRGEPVADQTGLAGVYNFSLKYADDELNANATDIDGVPSLFTALQETLGLRLQAQKTSVEILVVDRVDRSPTEN